MKKEIYFDIDGTIGNFYGVENWVDYLNKKDVYPYLAAKPLFNFSAFARLLHGLQNKGYKISIISWASKNADEGYVKEITKAKLKWLEEHLPSVMWDDIYITEYGVPKEEIAQFSNGILFDDDENNRKNWSGISFDEKDILDTLRILLFL